MESMRRPRTPGRKSFFSVKDIPDVETHELEIIPKEKEQKRRKLLDGIDGEKLKSTDELHYSKTVQHKGIGDKGEGNFQEPRKEYSARRNHQIQSNTGLFRLNGFPEQQHGFVTRSNTQNDSYRRMSTVSTVKNIRPSGTLTASNPPRLRPLSLRLSSRSSASSVEEVGASRGNSVKHSRADELGICSNCNKRFPNMSRVPGCSVFLCSTCRRKSRAVYPEASLINDFQTCAAKSPGSGQKQQNGRRERNIIGRTPDTAMELESSDEEEAVDNTGSGMNPCEQTGGFKIAYPSRTDPEAVEILASDIERLNPLEFLNDTIIDFYIKYIQREFLSLEGCQRFHFFNSFFYKKLSGVVGKKKKKKVADFSQLRKWTRGINIFEKDYLFIPVHDKLHWSLAIICFPNHGPGSGSGCERCILHLDSMTCGHDSLTVYRLVRRYLVAEGAEREGDASIKTLTCNDIPVRKVQVPLQENESDCGLFLLHYIRKFVERAPVTMKMSDVENSLRDIGMFGRQWFLPTEASSLRSSIQKQLQRLFAENGAALEVTSDASLESFQVGAPRKLEAEF